MLNLVTLLLVLFAGLAAFFAEPIRGARHRARLRPGPAGADRRPHARWMLLSTVVFGASGLIMEARSMPRSTSCCPQPAVV
ncbi:MAG: hypothetical protein R2838_05970 [Caldilineaceae bacterium]